MEVPQVEGGNLELLWETQQVVEHLHNFQHMDMVMEVMVTVGFGIVLYYKVVEVAVLVELQMVIREKAMMG